MAFEAGKRLGDYEVLDVLGRGGMGCVYRVRNIISNRVEAMKVLLGDQAGELGLGDRFLGEIRTLARLDHPNIAKFLTAFQLDHQLMMVMEFVEGGTLAAEAAEKRLPVDDVLRYVGQTLSALAYAHKNGVIHRDIKPSNVMITPQGNAKLMDFGIAKSQMDPIMTRPGTTVGSMLYMSPEQICGLPVDARSDLYSVGVMLYELAVGRRPFEADSPAAALHAQLNTPPTPPIEINPSISPALSEVILTAMQKDPAHRFASAEAFGLALESVRKELARVQASAAAPTVTQPPKPQQQPAQAASPAIPRPPQPIATSAKGNRALWATLGALACVCVLVVGAMTLPHFFKSSAASPRTNTPAPNTSPAPNNPTPANTNPVEPNNTPDLTRVTPDTKPTQPAPNKTPLHPTSRNSPANSSSVKQEPLPPLPDAQLPANNAGTGVQVNTPITPAGPSQADLDRADEELMKLHSRAEAVQSSLDNLRAQQAASGLGLRQDISSAASRMQNYLHASDRALQEKNLDNARKYMDNAETEIGRLETFFGR
jgi:serine/threonine-protein kinase